MLQNEKADLFRRVFVRKSAVFFASMIFTITIEKNTWTIGKHFGVFLWWCFCGGVFGVVSCGGVFVVVFLSLCLCGGVFVVVFLWWCFCGGVFALVFLWWCSCSGVFVVVFL